MVAKTLRLGGMWFGEDQDFISPAADNPEGFFEHERMVRLNDDLLEATGGAWDHPPAQGPLAVDDPRVTNFVERARETTADLSTHGCWGWKDPRVCLTAAFWRDLVTDLRFVICVRNPVEVAMSLKRRNQISYILALGLWEAYYTTILEEVPPDHRLLTHYEAHFESTRSEANRVLNFAALPRRGRAPALRAMNPELRHQRAKVSLADAGVPPAISRLYRHLCEEAGWVAEISSAARPATRVNRAVLDLVASKEVAGKQAQAISVLEAKVDDLQHERDRMADRLEKLQDERNRLNGRVGQLEDERVDLLGQIGSLQQTSRSLARQLEETSNALARQLEETSNSLARQLEETSNSLARQLEETSSSSAGQLEETSSSFARQLDAQSTTIASILRSVEPIHPAMRSNDQRLEDIEHSVYDLVYRSVAGARAGDPIVKACRMAVQDHVPLSDAVLVAGKSDPAFTEMYRRRVTNFPQDASGRYPGFALAHSQALVAHLESLRCAGNKFLLIPSTSRWTVEHYTAFGEHLIERYPVAWSAPDFGVLFDLTKRMAQSDEGPRSLSATVSQIAANHVHPLVVMDMTELQLGPRLPSHSVFVPSEFEGRLPYLDSSIDVVVIDTDFHLSEARRLAAEAVISVRIGSIGLPEVSAVELLSNPEPEVEPQIAVVLGEQTPPTIWLECFMEALAEEPSAFMATALSPDVLERADLVALVDEGVLPLPSCLSIARRAMTRNSGIGGVAVKMFARDGSLESAGSTVFADGSYADVGARSFDVAAPWHEYVRDACWGPGFMLYRKDAVKEAVKDPVTEHSLDGAQPHWAEAVWTAGYRVVYEPGAAAVRTNLSEGDGEFETTLSWRSHLRKRPPRPPVLDDMAWRNVLAIDDIAGGLR
jgi:hypothetical protein